MTTYVGGSFAPPLSDAHLAQYQELINALQPSPLREAMQACHDCSAKWWDLPESSGVSIRKDVSGRIAIVPLDAEIAKALWDHVPWDEELAMFAKLFDAIDPATEATLRNAAHHLLWHAVELSKDREPLTNDKL